ncbi:Gfo/Idh/MocA family oxidoreductase [Propioniciclava coleopterorum]|uniref:Gfo/Idh/MocA family oxidoreductase n=1 Tax=Propioniciclava coleopterorum TaxID=2714937 RepID=A0A6G7Y358_9ACTN|nr:Gfo/Idh/MocA family oxidoreductase [Propioniciclava coleopterorum]QIK71078.1 Gfo/Idh/MocA family oxidoreductase [Propioniciclava coleopterorum]
MQRYGLIGSGHRAQMYTDAIGGAHSDVATLVAIADSNPGRAEYHRDRMVAEYGYAPDALTLYGPDDVERMITEQQLDRVIVTSPDFTHAEMITRCLRAGVDVVVEKPLTIDADSANAIVDAVKETGHQVVVTFNYRYSPRNSALKEIIQSGQIGTPLSMTFEWVLDTAHGADYFRRWHREKANSGGLLIHKSSHHFDLINWWLADVPKRVYASGGVKFYGAENADARGLAPRPERGTHDGEHGPFELDLRDDPRLKALYLDNEQYDGYIRDQDVFGPGVTTEDNLAVIVDYEGGPTLSYALNAHSPWEGYRVAVNGTLGRAELEVIERARISVDADGKVVVDPSAMADQVGARDKGERLTVQKHFEAAQEVEIPEGTGGHGGGDALLLSDVFNGPGEDPLGRPSDYIDGLRAISVGICGNASLASGAAVSPADLGLDLSR